MTTSAALQQTLAASITVTGVGVHSGAPTQLTLAPAPVHHGIVFVRSDITDRDNRIPARWDLVTDTRLCTVLKNAAGASISTVEHVMSALTALGVDNALVTIDGPEVPIMDGSAADFVNAIDRVGRSEQSAYRKILRVISPVTVQDGDKTVTLTPANIPAYSLDIQFNSAIIGQQSFSHRLDEKTYRADIAFARTFGFLHEVEALRAAGLARGGSLDNAVVIDGDTVLNPGGLRSPTEFVRHKILDAIGDIALAGMPVIAHYHGVKAGHAINNLVLRAMFAAPESFVITDLAPRPKAVCVPDRLIAPVYSGGELATA